MPPKFLAAWILTAGALAAQTVEGRVINSATGSGIPDVAVGLLGSGQVDYRAITDGTGHFRIDAVKDGTYSPFYIAPNFSPDSNAPPFKVAAGAGPVQLEYKMFPRVKISGRVLDASGKPVPDATLMLTHATRGGSMVFTFKAEATGQYRSPEDLQPGEWILSASAPSTLAPPEPPPELHDNRRLAWAKTFYPGVTDAALAIPIVAQAGGELSNLDIKLATVPAHRLRGVVLDPGGKPVPKLSVLLSGHIMERPPSPPEDSSPDDGTFEFATIPEGEYRLSAILNKDGVKLWGAQSVHMRDRDLEQVELRLTSPFSVQGKVIMEVPEGQPAPQMPRVGMEHADASFMDSMPSSSGVFDVSPDAKGDFTFKNVYPGAYTIIPGVAPSPYYLDSIRLGSGDALGSDVQILSGAIPLAVTFKLNGGSVRGTVESCGAGNVVLMPQDPALRRDGFISRTRCAENGRYEIPAVRPGEYYALAVGKDNPIGIVNVPLDQSLINQSVRVTVRPNESTLADLRLIAR